MQKLNEQKKLLIGLDDIELRDYLVEVLKQAGNNVAVEDSVEKLLSDSADAIIVSPSKLRATQRKNESAFADGDSEDADEVAPSPFKNRDQQMRFDSVRSQFIAELVGEHEKLAALVPSLLEHDNASHEQALAICHRLFGTASTLRFPSLSQLLHRLELFLKEDGHRTAGGGATIRELLSEISSKAKSITALLNRSLDASLSGAKTVTAAVLVGRDGMGLPAGVADWFQERNVKMVEVNSDNVLQSAATSTFDACFLLIDEEDPASSLRLGRDLRNLPNYENLPLALISQNTESISSEEAAYSGACVLIHKDLNDRELKARLDELLLRTNKARILIIDDDPQIVEALSLLLRSEGFSPKGLTNAQELTTVLQEFEPDLVLLDLNMPDVHGNEICQTIRSMERWQDLPVIFVTAETSVKARLNCFRAGADDYLAKPIVTEELIARVKVRLERTRLMRERSDKDILSGLLNRRAFLEQADKYLADAKRNSSHVSLCILDVDKFKSINDNHGHLTGDEVIAQLGQLLRRRFRAEDIRGRWGGEEFVLLFRGITKETAKIVTERALDEFKRLLFVGEETMTFSASFSAGLATFPTDGETFLELMSHADKNLYQAKTNGRSLVI